MLSIELVVIVIVSPSASVKNTRFTKVLLVEFSFKFEVTEVITFPPVEPSLNLGASFGVTNTVISFSIVALNVSVAVAVNVCPCTPPTKSVLNDDDSANAFKVRTPLDATLTKSSE